MNKNTLAYQNILVGVALLQGGESPAVARAVNIARKTGGQVTLIHAMKKGEKTDILPIEVEKAESQLKSLQAEYSEVKAFKLVPNRTWAAINDTADEIKADLVVIGSHLHGQLLALLGATSDQVLHHARRDVLVVRSEIYQERAVSDYTQIIAATDLRKQSQAACATAAFLAEKYGASLKLLHVLEHFPVDRENEEITPEDHDPETYQRKKRADALEEFAQECGCQDADREILITSESAANGVSAYTPKENTALIVVGTQATQKMTLLFGSTVDNIIHHAPCDVLVARENGNVSP